MKTPTLAVLAVATLLAGPLPAMAQDEGEKPEAVKETDAEQLERMTGSMMKEVERLRGLKFKTDVKRVWKSRDEAKAEMISEIDKQMPPETILAFSKALAFFGILKEGDNLKDVFAEFISAGAGGYYIPDQKTFSLVRGYSEDASMPIIFHELVHAVEDQYYDFDERTKKYMEEDQDDRNGALHALVEGSARTYENMYVDGEPGRRAAYMKAQMEGAQEQIARIQKLPPQILLGVGIFPYENGSGFIAKVLPKIKGEGEGAKDHIEAMAHLFENPPASTEQILHPEKYMDAVDLPQEVTLPDLSGTLGEDWKNLLTNTFGEFQTALNLNRYFQMNNFMAQMSTCMGAEMRNGVPTQFVKFYADAKAGSEGWDGDRYAVFSRGDDVCAVMVSTWDTDKDAKEYAKLYVRLLAKKYETKADASDAETTDSVRFSATRSGATGVDVAGRNVYIAERVPADRLEAVMKALRSSTITQAKADTVPGR